MAELIGLAASIVQLGGAGTELSKALYNFVSSATRADTELTDLAGDVKVTSRALDRVAETLEAEVQQPILTQDAIDDAQEAGRRCKSIFDEISNMFEKRYYTGKDGKRRLSLLGKATWPMKEQRVELLRRRLESLKLSLLMLLSVLQLAHVQAKDKSSTNLRQYRQTIHTLHMQRKRAIKREQTLQEQLRVLHLDSVAASPMKTDVSLLQAPPGAPPHGLSNDAFLLITDEAQQDSSTSFTMDDLKKCAIHVEGLLEHIVRLQKSLDLCQSLAPHQRRHVHKSFTRYRHVFGADISRITIPPQQMLPTFGRAADMAHSVSEVPVPQSSAVHHPAVLVRSDVVPSLSVQTGDVGRLQARHLRSTSPAREAGLQSTAGGPPAQVEPQMSPYPHRALRRTDTKFSYNSYEKHAVPRLGPSACYFRLPQRSDYGDVSMPRSYLGASVSRDRAQNNAYLQRQGTPVDVSLPYMETSLSSPPPVLVARPSAMHAESAALSHSMPLTTDSPFDTTPTTLTSQPPYFSRQASPDSISNSMPYSWPGGSLPQGKPLSEALSDSSGAWVPESLGRPAYPCSSIHDSPVLLPEHSLEYTDDSRPRPGGSSIVTFSDASLVKLDWSGDSRSPMPPAAMTLRVSNNEKAARESKDEATANESQRVPVAIACLPCRNRRLECDGGICCTRCRADDVGCTYLKTRRASKGKRKYRPENIYTGVPGLAEGMSSEVSITDARTGPLIAYHQHYDIPDTENSVSTKEINEKAIGGDQILPDRDAPSYTDRHYEPSISSGTVYNSVNHTRMGRVSKAKKGAKLYDCECGRSYSRPEHLRRHQKNHAYVDAMACTFPGCGKSFFRSDLLARHQERHKEDPASAVGDDSMPVAASLSMVAASETRSFAKPSTCSPQMRFWPSSPDLPATFLPSASHGSSIGLDLSSRVKRGIEEADPELTQQENCSANKRRKTMSVDGQGDNASDTIVSAEWFTGTESADNTDDGCQDDESIVDALLERWTVAAVVS